MSHEENLKSPDPSTRAMAIVLEFGKGYPAGMQVRMSHAIMTALLEERERCAKIADAEEERHRRGGPASSMAEDTWGAATAKDIAAAIRDPRSHDQQSRGSDG